MKIKAKLSGDFACKSIRYYAKTNARMFNGSLDVRMSEDALSATFGDELAGLAFAGVSVDEDGNVSWGFRKIVPDVKCGAHLLQLSTKSAGGPEKLGPTLGVIPEVSELSPAKDELKVVVTLVFPIEAKDRALCGALAMAVGEIITAELDPKPEQKQEKLPGVAADPSPPVATPTGPHGNLLVMPGV